MQWFRLCGPQRHPGLSLDCIANCSAAMQLDGPALDAVEAADASQNLKAIASLLGVDPSGQHQLAAPLLALLNQRLTSAVQALPPSFFAPLLPPGSLSSAQVVLCLLSLPRQRLVSIRPEQDLLVGIVPCLAEDVAGMEADSQYAEQSWDAFENVRCAQVEVLEELAADLAKEYTVRRQMLIERAKVVPPLCILRRPHLNACLPIHACSTRQTEMLLSFAVKMDSESACVAHGDA